MNDESLAKLSGIFRRKMHDVFAKNDRPSAFGDSMAFAFNAWQRYLMENLRLEVQDIEEGEQPGLLTRGGKVEAVRIINPSNGAGYSREFIIVPLDLREKVVVLGDLPNDF